MRDCGGEGLWDQLPSQGRRGRGWPSMVKVEKFSSYRSCPLKLWWMMCGAARRNIVPWNRVMMLLQGGCPIVLLAVCAKTMFSQWSDYPRVVGILCASRCRARYSRFRIHRATRIRPSPLRVTIFTHRYVAVRLLTIPHQVSSTFR